MTTDEFELNCKDFILCGVYHYHVTWKGNVMNKLWCW